MKRLFLNFEKSLKLKELGFNDLSLGYYLLTPAINDRKLKFSTEILDSQKRCESVHEGFLAPLYVQAFDFLLKDYRVLIRVSVSGIGFEVRRTDWEDNEFSWFETKDEALEKLRTYYD